MKTFLKYVAVMAVMGCAANALAEEQYSIAAIVNDDIISSLDVQDRVKLIIGTTGLTDSAETRANLTPQILRSMIDEKLQQQEVNRNGIIVSDAEMNQAYGMLEKQNNQPPGSFAAFLERKGLSRQSFQDQVKAQIGWSKLLMKKVRGRIKITDNEIKQNRLRLSGNAGSGNGSTASEVKITTISLPVYAPENEASTIKLAQKLVNEIRGGANFDAVAAQFTGEGADSASTGAFWVQVAQLDPAIGKALTKLTPGSVSDPIRTASGYQIVKLLDIHQSTSAPAQDDVELALKQIVLTLKPDAKSQEVDVLMQIAKLVGKSPGTCTEKGIAGVKPEDIAEANIDVSFNRIKAGDLSPDIRTIVEKLGVGQVSEPFATPKGIHLLMLCERVDIPADATDKEKIREALFQEKIGLEAAKYMRTLRREAFIEVKH